MSGSWASGWLAGDIVTAAELSKSAGAIYNTTLGAAAASIDITGINQSYAHLMLMVAGRSDGALAATACGLRFNGDSSASYLFQMMRATGATVIAQEGLAQTLARIGNVPAATAEAGSIGTVWSLITNYAEPSSFYTEVASANGYHTAASTGTLFSETHQASWRASGAITQITLLPVVGNWVAGTRATLYAFGS